MVSTDTASFAQKQHSLGRRVLSGTQAAYTGEGHPRNIPLRKKTDGRVIWAKADELSYYLNPLVKPLDINNRREDGECLFERITVEEARRPQPKAHAAAPVRLPTSASRQSGKTRKRKRGRRG